MNAGAVVVVGHLVDRFGARTVILPSALLFGLAFMSLHFLTASLWHFYALYLVLGIIGSGTAPIAYSKVISHWFDKKRGLALALAMTGISVGAFILPPLAQALITTAGWRQAYVFLGFLTVAGTLPMVGLLLKESPQLMGLAPDGGPETKAGLATQHSQEPGLSGAEAWHTASFWLMAGEFFLVSVSFHGYIVVPIKVTDPTMGFSMRLNAALMRLP